jgi:hypothetical protein
MDTSEKQSRIKAYLQARYSSGFTIETDVDLEASTLMFRVRDPGGQRGSLLVLSEEFVDDYWDEIEQELDSRDVVGAMEKVGQGKVLVTTLEQVVLEPE